MSPGNRLRKTSISDQLSRSQIKPLRTVSTSPAADKKMRSPDPSPIPSSNPASQYTLLEKLGTGSFGVVYKAIHNETKQIVAVKQIGKSFSLHRF
jgi:serine/threonine-protein kinase 24/25/MST4